MSVHITVLTDNMVHAGGGLLAEHGLCLLVETAGSKVLLDTGQTDICVTNAARLGADLGGLNAAVLSHGHYDHGGGLPALLDALGRLEVIAHPGAFASKYARRSGEQDRHIGLAYSADDLMQRGAVVRLEPDAHEISGGLIATGFIPRITGFEKNDPHFWVKADGRWELDHLEDDQALVARTAEGLVVVLGCAHAGVINTLRHAVKLTGDERIRAVVGGLHLASASLARTEVTVAALRQMDVGQVVACHCTGFAAGMRLHAAFGRRFVNGVVGLKLTLQKREEQDTMESTANETRSAKVAISTDGDSVAAHFGRCQAYTIVEIADGAIKNRELISNPGHEPGFLPGYLAQRGVTCIVAGGIGRRAQMLFDQQGIETIVGIPGTIEETLQALLRGELEGGESLCEH